MLVKFTKLAKRRNSTKQPTSFISSYDVTLKAPTSLENPTILIKGFNPELNYCLFNNNYFFVTDVIAINNDIFEVTLEKDVLSTYKTAISNYVCFVERSASSYNPYINDSELSSEQRLVNTQKEVINIGSLDTSGNGTFVLRVVGTDVSYQEEFPYTATVTGGGIKTYCVSQSQLNTIIRNSFKHANSGFNPNDAIFNVAKNLINPFQYVVECFWLPVSNFGSTSERIMLANYDTGVNGMEYDTEGINNRGTSSVGQLSIPTYYGDFRDYSPNFSQYTIFVPGIGTVNLGAQDTSEQITYEYGIDFKTGDVFFTLSHSGTGVFSINHGNIKTPIQLAQSESTGAVTGIVGAMANVSGGNLLGTLSSICNTAYTLIQPTTSTIGGVGSSFEITKNNKMVVCQKCFGSADFPVNILGRPLYQNVKLGNLSGYTKCNGASIPLDCHADDIDRINSMLNSGFYIE